MHPGCLIAGCGYVGRRLVRRLQSGRDVTALLRSPAHAAALHAAGVAAICADLDEPLDIDWRRTIGCGASVAYLVPPPERGAADPRLGRFLASLADAPPSALLYMSTTGVYGDARGKRVSEKTAPAPASERARRRLAAEDSALHWCEQRSVRCVVLRVPGIFGPGRLPLDRLRRGDPALHHADAGPGNRIHVDDLVDCCVAALDRAVDGVINVCDDDHATTTAFLEATARLAGLPPPPLVALAEARERISPGLMSFLAESRTIDNRRMHEDLGVRSRFASLESAITASLAERD